MLTLLIFYSILFSSLLFSSPLVSSILTGVLGVKVAIMLPWDYTGRTGPKTPQPDVVKILEPKEEEVLPAPGYGQQVPQQQQQEQQQPQQTQE